MDEIISEEDDIVLILLGLNDRKRKDGMNELKEKIEEIIFNPGEVGDGLHPGNFVQELMLKKIISILDI